MMSNKKQDQLQFKWLEEPVVTQMKWPLRSFSTFFFASGAAAFVIFALVFVCEHVKFWLKRVLTWVVVQNIDIKDCGCEMLCEELK